MNILIFFIFISNTFSYLIFPLTKEYVEITSSDNHIEIIRKLYDSKFFITINIGSERVNVKAFITQSNTELFIGGKNIINHKYNELSSESYNNTNNQKIEIKYGSFKEGILSTENFYVNNENNETQTISNMSFILATESRYSDDSVEGEIGLHLPYLESKPDYNFILSLKRANGIKSYNWFFYFDNFSKGEGKMIVDGYPHNLNDKIYIQEKFSQINILKNSYYGTWGFKFTSIYYDESYLMLSNNVEAHFEFNLGIITAPLESSEALEQFFFGKYINDNICFKEKYGVYNQYFFYCKDTKKFNAKEFKSIYLKSQELEIIFELDYKDLFFYKNGYVYFLILFKKDSNIWQLGEIFLKKYYIVFNQNSETIGYYQGLEKEKTKDKKKFKINLIHILLILILLSVIIVGIIIYMKKGRQRKNRANELDDDYEYESKVNSHQQIENKLITEDNNIN